MSGAFILIPFVAGCFVGWLATSFYYIYQIRKTIARYREQPIHVEDFLSGEKRTG